MTLPNVTTKVTGAGSSVWDDRHTMGEEQEQSQHFWHGLTADERAGVLAQVRAHLERLSRCPEAWVPASLVGTEGQRLDIRITLDFPARSVADLRRLGAAEGNRRSIVEAFLELERELRGD